MATPCIEPAFTGAGAKAGIEVWRIEALKPVKCGEDQGHNGKFYTGDSYILLHSIMGSTGKLSWNIHFWLGAETSLDESGVAAYKSIELDDYLGGSPVQFREVQGEESHAFMNIFKDTGGVEYLPGGIDSGFQKVERDVWPTRLLHLKGSKTVRVQEVPIELKSLNKGDVFILDAGLKLYVFNGPTANKYEKAKGLEVVQHIYNDQRGARAEITLVHEEPENEEFWSHFGGYVDPNSLPEGEDDAVVANVKFVNKLFIISDETGEIVFEPVTLPDGKLRKEMLVGDDIALLHTSSKIYLWIGRKANLNEKKEATARAVKYITSNGLPFGFPIERISEGCEPGAFKAEFYLWDAPKPFTRMSHNIAAKAEEVAPDVQALLNRKAEEDKPVDDGSGELTIWVVQDFKKVEIPKDHYGHFFGGDSYILLYSYKKNNRDEHIIYFWLGGASTVDERGAAALLAMQLDDSMGGRPVQVRVTQGKEPAHFRQLFKGKTVIYQGGREKGDGGAGATLDETCLLHIRGTTDLNTVSVQVDAVASSLNSTDSFVLVTQDKVFAWLGGGANEDEQRVAESICKMMADGYNDKGGRSMETIREGSEPEEFWTILGGKMEYASVGPGEHAPRDPRLFSASTATGSFKVEEVDQFDQTDLNDEDVFLMDTFTSLFVWIGSQATTEEKDKAMEFAARFISEAEDGRDGDMPVIRVNAGDEPSMFSCHFHPWDPEYTKKNIYVDPYQAKLDALAAERKQKAEALTKATADGSTEGASPLKAWSATTGAEMGSGKTASFKRDPSSSKEPAKKWAIASPEPPKKVEAASAVPKPTSFATASSGGSGSGISTSSKEPVKKWAISSPEPPKKVEAASSIPKPTSFATATSGGGGLSASSSKAPTKKWSISAPEPPKKVEVASVAPGSFAVPPSASALSDSGSAPVTAETLEVSTFYSTEQLKAGVVLPEGVVPALREQYLSETDFSATFDMSKKEFNDMKKWKRDDLKKKKNIF